VGERSNSLNEIAFVGHLGMTTSFGAKRLRDVGLSPPIANGKSSSARSTQSGTAARRVRPDAASQRPLSVSMSNFGDPKAFASNVDAMLLDFEDAAPGDTFSYPENS
jgi:hypothetical protein